MRTLALAAAVVLAGCMSFWAPSGAPGITETFAERWGCDYDQVMASSEWAWGNTSAGSFPVVRPGHTACQAMARWGHPSGGIDLHDSQYGRSATWWYNYPTRAMVTLVEDADGWEVDYVSR